MADVPTPDAVLEATEAAGYEGAICATLTPLIRRKLDDLASGQILEIRTHDHSAKLDVPSWCRLSGNPLLATLEEGSLIRFLIRKK